VVEDEYRKSEKPTETAVVGSIFSYLGAIACIGALTAALSTILRGSPSIPVIAGRLIPVWPYCGLSSIHAVRADVMHEAVEERTARTASANLRESI